MNNKRNYLSLKENKQIQSKPNESEHATNTESSTLMVIERGDLYL